MIDEALYEKAILWAKKKGFIDLKVNTEDYDQPSGFTSAGFEEKLVPDITGVSLGSKHFAAIVEKGDPQPIVSKWKLFSTIASSKGGRLYLLAPKGTKAFTDKLVKQYHIDATVISI